MARQRVSDQLRAQDQQTVRGVALVLKALYERYPNSLELKSAIRDMEDLDKQLAPELSVAQFQAEQIQPGSSSPFPSAEATGS